MDGFVDRAIVAISPMRVQVCGRKYLGWHLVVVAASPPRLPIIGSIVVKIRGSPVEFAEEDAIEVV